MIRLIQGDVISVLDKMNEMGEEYQCVVTSPPYFSKRDYGVPPTVWYGGDVPILSLPGHHAVMVIPGRRNCKHSWGPRIPFTGGAGNKEPSKGPWQHRGADERGALAQRSKPDRGRFCVICGAWEGRLGLEPSTWLYISHLVMIFRKMRGVLRDDGVFWLNIDDCRSASSMHVPSKDMEQYSDLVREYPHLILESLSRKELAAIPQRIVLALQADGWVYRGDPIWAKSISLLPAYVGTSMPDSASDRTGNAHEYIYMFTKNPMYYYDNKAVEEEPVGGRSVIRDKDGDWIQKGRNLRSVWAINPSQYKGTHSAVFPPELPRVCILASTSEKGACPECGTPIERQVERLALEYNPRASQKQREKMEGIIGGGVDKVTLGSTDKVFERETGWQPTCNHDFAKPVPCRVLDPFGGSGTTAMEADRLGRDVTIIDIVGSNIEEAHIRLHRDGGIFTKIEREKWN